MPRTHRTGRRPDPTVLSLQTEVSSSESPTPSPRSQGPTSTRRPAAVPAARALNPRRRDETAEHQPGKGPVGIAHRGSTSTSTPALPREKVGPTTQHVLTSMNRTSTPSGSRRSSCSARRRSHTCSNRARSSGSQRSRWANAPRTPLQPRSVADPNSIAGRSTHDRLAARRSCCGATRSAGCQHTDIVRPRCLTDQLIPPGPLGRCQPRKQSRVRPKTRAVGPNPEPLVGSVGIPPAR
jgi:hypothetical protein